MSERGAYLLARSRLIEEERSLRCDVSYIQDATDAEKKAIAIVQDIKTEEAKSIWSVDHEGITNIFPGMQFLSAKRLVVKTKIFQILSKMPKGAMLHGHLDAMVDRSFLLNAAMKHHLMNIRVSEQLIAANINQILPEFKAFPIGEHSDTTSLTSPEYKPGTWVSLQTARDRFEPALGGPEGFDAWLLGTMTINPAEAYGTHNSVLKIWEKFQSIFIVANGLIAYEPIMADYFREFLLSSIDDGISYVEVRAPFFLHLFTRKDGHQNFTHREMVKLFEDTVRAVKEEMAKAGRQDDFYGARIIYSTLRSVTCEELEWYLNDCIELKKEFPHLIAGFDLVGNENTLRPLVYYIDPLMNFRKRCEELELDLPFIFHAGETLGDGTNADDNLYDAILLGTKRIGHGFSLAKHPRLIEIVKDKGILIEMCPISNEILRLTSSVSAHPLPIMINNGVPVSLCSDDPAIFGNMGLTYDFFQVLVASEINGLMTMKALACQGLEHSTLGNEDKEKALEAYERRWTKFIDAINDGSIYKS